MIQRYTEEEWNSEGERLFGPDRMQWGFVCPACGHIANVSDWKEAGAKDTHVAFSCVGRFSKNPRDAFAKGPGPCNYAGGGLIGLNPIEIEGRKNRYFAFALRTASDERGDGGCK